MRTRIKRFLKQRTDMLAGVSHDLRTLFCIASITDYFDGYIARIRNEVTNFGTFLDPIADKLLVAAVIFKCRVRISNGTVITNIARDNCIIW